MYQDYIKHIRGDEYLIKWGQTTLKNYLVKNKPTNEEVEHVLDFLVQHKGKISQMSYPEAKSLTEKWDKSQQKKGQTIQEKPEDTETLLDFGDGFKVVKLIGENAYKREGFLMRHCVASYYGKSVEIYSLRDKDNMPHCTMEKDQQIKGKGNGDIHPKYIGYVVQFLEKVGMTVGDSEMSHLGYINVEKFKKEFDKETKDQLINDKYLPKNQKWIDKKGEEFISLEILEQIPLVSKCDGSLKINFELPMFIKLSVNYIFKKSRKISTKNSATSGDDAHSATSGNYAHSATSGDGAHSATSGYGAHSATSGYGAHSATSGNGAHSATSGDDAHSATSGNGAHSATSGNRAHSATSGDGAHSATSGDDAHSATSGNYAHSATSGNRANSATSGYGAHSATSGDDAIACSVGRKASAKASLGCWIVLAEWYEGEEFTDAKPVAIQAVQVDGKKIKEDTWYKLENKKFVEVKDN